MSEQGTPYRKMPNNNGGRQRIGGALFTNKENMTQSLIWEPARTWVGIDNARGAINMQGPVLLVACIWEMFNRFVFTLFAGMILIVVDRTAANALSSAVFVAAALTAVRLGFNYVRRNVLYPNHGDPARTWLALIMGEIGLIVALSYWVSQFVGAILAFLILGVGETHSLIPHTSDIVPAQYNFLVNDHASGAIALGSLGASFAVLLGIQCFRWLLVTGEATSIYEKLGKTRRREGMLDSIAFFGASVAAFLVGFRVLDTATLAGLHLVARTQLSYIAIAGMTVYEATAPVDSNYYFIALAACWGAAIVMGFVQNVTGRTDGETYDTYTKRNQRTRSAAKSRGN